MNKTVLVTGASGFVGSHFVANAKDYNIIEVDLLQQKVENISFDGVDTVLHLAALVHQMKGASEEEYFRINRDLTLEVAKKAKRAGVKNFVLMSTVKVYGEYTDGVPWTEESECNPTDAYGKSKLEAEILFKKEEINGFKVAIVRSPLVYGAGVKANMLNLIKLVDKLPILPLGDINNKRSMIYVGNLVSLIKLIIELEVSGVFLANYNGVLSTTKLVELISLHLNKKRLLIAVPGIVRRLIKVIRPLVFLRLFGSLELNNKKTNELLKFAPPYSVDDGIGIMIEWYKKY